MRKAIICTVIGEQSERLFSKSRPRIDSYAARTGSDLIVNSKASRKYPHYAKMDGMKAALESHDRVLGLDIDLLVKHDCPDLFEIVPVGDIGMFDEFAMANEEQRKKHLEVVEAATEFWKLPRNEACTMALQFWNTGVVVADKSHSDLFTVPDGDEMFGNYWDQGLISARITLKGIKPFDIGWRFNRMPYADKTVNEHRLWSNMIHYAGLQDLNIMDLDMAALDAYERNPEYFGKRIATLDIKKI